MNPKWFIPDPFQAPTFKVPDPGKSFGYNPNHFKHIRKISENVLSRKRINQTNCSYFQVNGTFYVQLMQNSSTIWFYRYYLAFYPCLNPDPKQIIPDPDSGFPGPTDLLLEQWRSSGQSLPHSIISILLAQSSRQPFTPLSTSSYRTYKPDSYYF